MNLSITLISCTHCGPDMATDYYFKSSHANFHKTTAKLYAFPLDVLGELVQNSMKSILERQQSEKNHKGLIQITIDANQKRIRVIDNGRGFNSLDEIGLSQSGWSKKSPEAGFGYGLTSLMLMSDSTVIHSINTKKKAMGIQFVDSYKKNMKQKNPKSWFPKSENPPSPSGLPAETSVEIKGTKMVFQAFWEELNEWHGKKDKDGKKIDLREMVEGALLWHTALGYTTPLWKKGSPAIEYSLNIIYSGYTDKKKNKKFPVGHPLTSLPSGLKSYITKVKSPYKLKDDPGQLDVITRNYECVTKPVPKLEPSDKAKVRMHGVSMAVVSGADSVIDRMKHHFSKFPMYAYDGDRFFVSINGFPQTMRLPRPSTGGNKSIYDNSLIVVDIDTNSDCIDAGRNRLAYGFDSFVEDRLYKNAVVPLDKVQQGKTKSPHNASVIRNAALQLMKEPWPSKHVNLPLVASPRKPSDEGYVSMVFGGLLGLNLIKEIQPIIVGNNHDTYDLVFCNLVPCDKLSSSVLKDWSLTKAKSKGKTHFEATNLPMLGEFKTDVSGLIKDLEKSSTLKVGTDISYLVCWTKGNLPRSGWLLDPKAIGDGTVRCSNYILKRNSPSTSIEVLIIDEYMEAYDSHIDTKAKGTFPF